MDLLRPWAAICLFGILLILLPNDSEQGEHEKKLINKLMDGYQALERPVEDENKPIVVYLGVTLQNLIDVDEKNQIVTSNCWLNFNWTDRNLKWDPKDYGNVTSIRIHPKYLWVPDVLMYNSANENFDAAYQTNVIVFSDGSTSYIPPGMFLSTCKIDITWFPFDKQECILKFGSWTYDGSKLDLRLMAPTADLTAFTLNGEWDLLEMPAERNVEFYECCPDAPYIDLKYKFVLLRRKLYYLVNLIVPAVLLSLLTLITFTIPPDAGEKISFAVTILLSLTVFLLMVAEQLPSTSDAVPLLAIYFGIVMMLCAGSVIFTIVVLSFHHRSSSTHDMPRWVKRGICEWAAWLLCMKRPGHDLTRKGILRSGREQDKEMEMAEKNKSLLSNALDIDDESGVLVNSHLNGHYPGVNKHDAENHNAPAANYELRAILREMRAITDKLREDEEAEAITDDWKFAAAVVDRYLFILFGIASIVASIAILFSAPTMFM